VIADITARRPLARSFKSERLIWPTRNSIRPIPALLAVDDVYAYPTWSARALLEAGRAFEQLQADRSAKQADTQAPGEIQGRVGRPPAAASVGEPSRDLSAPRAASLVSSAIKMFVS